MSRHCPHCHAVIGRIRNRIRVQYARRPGVPWYRYSATRYLCPTCGVALREVARPLGHALRLLMVAASGAYILFFLLHPSVLLHAGALAGTGLLFIVGPLEAGYRKWGFSYSEDADAGVYR
ncbi:MAG: hypothetical protein ACYCOU_22010 [Sulfobacillus sp.]